MTKRTNVHAITDKMAMGFETPAKNYKIYFDAKVTGFGVRVMATGARAYILNYRAAGVERRLTIGDVHVWQCSTAREEARRLLKDVYHGGDPLGEKKAQRELPTMDDLMERFERDYFPRLRPSSLKPYRNATTRIRKRWKHTLVQDLTHGMWMRFLTRCPGRRPSSRT